MLIKIECFLSDIISKNRKVYIVGTTEGEREGSRLEQSSCRGDATVKAIEVKTQMLSLEIWQGATMRCFGTSPLILTLILLLALMLLWNLSKSAV